MSFSVVFSGLWVDPSDFLDEERFRWCFSGTGPAPRTLERSEREGSDNAMEVERGAHPSR